MLANGLTGHDHVVFDASIVQSATFGTTTLRDFDHRVACVACVASDLKKHASKSSSRPEDIRCSS
jgi:hypothetical protein